MAVNTDDAVAGVPRGGGTFANPSDPLVWWGYNSSTGGSRPAGDRGFASATGGVEDRLPGLVKPPASISSASGKPSSNAETDRVTTVSQAKQQFYNMSEADRKKWAQHLLSLGLITEAQSRDFYTLQKWWEQLVTDAAGVYNNGSGKRLDPWATARLVAGDADAIAARQAEGRAAMPFTGTKSQTSTSVDLTDPTTAKALINDVLAQALGRAATPDELTAFTAVLNEAERKNPTQTVTSTTYQNGDAVSSSSTSSGGLTGAARQQLLMDQAQESPDFGAYQAATTYYGALLQAIRSPV